eukprot:NODE_38_length_30618_cov_0.377142.p4 type:complete len:433 gc:universal NODE_38_length_30618_cov_0.377142:11753-10455(-)
MRIGLSDKTLITCISQAAAKFSSFSVKEAESVLKSVYCSCPSFDLIIPLLLDPSVGISLLQDNCVLVPGIPVKPMLAHPTKGIAKVLDRFENKTFTCEYKYDGERAQLHYSKKGCWVYSRNSENLSDKYPDVLALIPTITEAESYILDCETLACDPIEGIQPFQALQKRKRKNVMLDSIDIPVIVVAFDLLYLNGESLLQHPFNERRELLYKHFKQRSNVFEFAKNKDCTDVEQITEYLNESVLNKCEGLMLKTLLGRDSTYEPSKRSLNWFKLKKDYLDSTMGDSLDLVVMGAFYGKGKRSGGLGTFVVGTWDEDEEVYKTVCKLGTGFKDEELDVFSNLLMPLKVAKKPEEYQCKLEADVWVEPKHVWEIQCADLTKSPVHTSGISLRFPRFLRIRNDKSAQETTSIQRLLRMYDEQAQITKDESEDDDQ